MTAQIIQFRCRPPVVARPPPDLAELVLAWWMLIDAIALQWMDAWSYRK